MLRGRRDRLDHELALRQRQGRSRGAPRHRRDLHGCRSGDDGARWLADDRVPDSERRTLLRRYVLPQADVHSIDEGHHGRMAQQALGHRQQRGCADGSRRSHRTRRTGSGPGRTRGARRFSECTHRSIRPGLGRIRWSAEVPQHDEPRFPPAASPQRAERRPAPGHRGVPGCNGQWRDV